MKTEAIRDFFSRLDHLPKGDRTALKREAGTMLFQADGRAIRAFYQCLPVGTASWQEERFFAAACLHCLWGDETGNRLPLEQIFYRLGRDAQVSDSTAHRLEGILDLSWEEDGFLLGKLTRLIKLVKSKNYAVDCAALLNDLLYWNGDKQTVQLKWARALYCEPEEDKNEKQEGE
ncbi:MAG: type I-E CRISPR-associated protein Cse2/CasB [Evtepia sp.]|nr:type I-E CRISPR-associated protein Cse2/CasB [Evtepia sp.]